MVIGFVISSSASVFKEFFGFLKKNSFDIEVVVVVDRVCGALEFCKSNNISCSVIFEKDNAEFSKKASVFFKENNVDFLILFYSRMITSQLFDSFPTFNLHPSILPSYKGMSALKDSLNDGALFQGCTLHLVDQFMDSGRKIIQAVLPISSNDLEKINKISFMQKVLVLFLFIDYVYNNGMLILYNNIERTANSISVNIPFCSEEFKNYFLHIESIQGERVYYEL